MSNLFDVGTPQQIPDVLANRDRRVALQNQLITEYPTDAVIAAKLNIPGPIKNNPQLKNFFLSELKVFEHQLKAKYQFVVAAQWLDESTGPERFYLVKGSAKEVKRLAVAFEESQPARRLFDLDVLTKDNDHAQSLSRTVLNLPQRTCLICGHPAKECARSRQHTVAELQNRVAELIENCQ